MMHVADTRDCAFEAFITNLGKYNEGFLVGEWVEFPVTNEEMQAVFRRIGIGRRYEEWFITDYDCPDEVIGKVLGEYESLSELNYLAGQIMELRESDDFWQAVLDLGENTFCRNICMGLSGRISDQALHSAKAFCKSKDLKGIQQVGNFFLILNFKGDHSTFSSVEDFFDLRGGF